jgi:hypothetical protein
VQNLALQAAGSLAILVAIAHGAIGELRVLTKPSIEETGRRDILRMVWQASTVDWIGFGILLIAAPSLDSPAARQWIIGVAVAVYGYAAVGNAIANRGRHIGWCLMGIVVSLALIGR